LFYPSVPVDVFREICHFFDKYYKVIHFSEIEDYFSKKNKKPAAIITFDDGLMDIHKYAFPILEEMNLKFNVNIDTEILETSKPQDFVRVYDMLNTTKIDSFMNRNFMESPIIIDKTHPINTENEFTDLLSKLSIKKRRQFVEEMSEISGMKSENFSKVLSIENIKELNKSGLVEFGSHSHTHSILTNLSEDELKIELKYSKSILENILEDKIDIIAYPNGVCNEKTDVFSKSLGYKYILKTNDKINFIDKKMIKEHCYERINQYHSSLNLSLAHTYGITRMIRKIIK
jgi:peptidoglycan/xylan/chitin deacetylase (PgdA/CDA1 family)